MNAYLYALTRRIRRLILTNDPARFFVVSVFLLILAIVALAIFVFAKSFFYFLSVYPAVFTPFSLYIFQTVLLGLYIFAVGSYIFLFYKRFKAKENMIFKLANSPALSIFFKSLFETAIFGSWAIFVLVIPAFLGYNTVKLTSFTLLIKQLIGLLLYILLALIPAATIVLLLANLRQVKIRKFLVAGVSILLVTISILVTRIFLPNRLLTISSNPNVDEVIEQLARLPVASQLLPSAQMAQILVSGNGLFSLLSTALIATIILLFLVLKFSQSFWQKFQEGVFIADPKQKVGPNFIFKFPARFTFLFKDLLQLFRIPSNSGYFLFVGFIALVYIAVLSKAPVENNIVPFYKTAVHFGALLIPGYLLLTLLMQFVFPSLQQEAEKLFLFIGITQRWRRVIKDKLAYALLITTSFTLITYIATIALFKKPILPILDYGLYVFTSSIILFSFIFTIGSSFTKFLKPEFGDQTTNIPGLFATSFGIVIIILNSLAYLYYQSESLIYFAVLGILSITASFNFTQKIIKKVDIL